MFLTFTGFLAKFWKHIHPEGGISMVSKRCSVCQNFRYCSSYGVPCMEFILSGACHGRVLLS